MSKCTDGWTLGEVAWMIFVLIAFLLPLVGITLMGMSGERWHKEVCSLRLASAATEADSLRVIAADRYCNRILDSQ